MNMTNNTSTIISTGNTYRFFDSAVKTHDDLPVATYKVDFHPMMGYSLAKASDLQTGEEKIYGNHEARVTRMLKTYNRGDRSLGVLLSGDKGMGKTLMVRMLASRILAEQNIPVVIVTQNTPGLAEFLDVLGEVAVIFDEFEKVFEKEDGDMVNSQNQFLGLFDGMSAQRRLYIITVNRENDLRDYFINRPGRFHYHLRFTYPKADAIREYLKDQLPDLPDSEVEAVVRYSYRVDMNYDHLRAVAFELATGELFAEVIGDLNIKPGRHAAHAVQIKFKDNTTLQETTYVDLFREHGGTEVFSIRGGHAYLQFRTDLEDIEISESGYFINPENIKILRYNPGTGEDTKEAPPIESIKFIPSNELDY